MSKLVLISFHSQYTFLNHSLVWNRRDSGRHDQVSRIVANLVPSWFVSVGRDDFGAMRDVVWMIFVVLVGNLAIQLV